MVTLNDTTLRANVWETVYDLLVAANLGASTVTVTSAYIDDVPTFPQVVVRPIQKSNSDYTIDSTHSTSTKQINVIIELYTKKALQIDTISDEIENTITNIAGLSKVTFDSMPGEGRDVNGNKIHMNVITVGFVRRS